jgi:hypothetical protein
MSYLAHRRKYFQIPGCVAYYTLNEASGDALDSVAGNDGTPSGVTYGATGKIGDAYTFDGINDYVSMGDVLDFNYDEEFSISAWVKCDTLLRLNTIAAKLEGASNYRGWQFYIASDNKINLAFIDTLSNLTSFSSPAVISSTGVWYHVAATKPVSATTGWKIYLNGVSQTLADDSVGTLASSTLNAVDLSIGGRSTIVDGYFDGEIDEVALFDTALTAAQITELYNSGTGKTYPF